MCKAASCPRTLSPELSSDVANRLSGLTESEDGENYTKDSPKLTVLRPRQDPIESLKAAPGAIPLFVRVETDGKAQQGTTDANACHESAIHEHVAFPISVKLMCTENSAPPPLNDRLHDRTALTRRLLKRRSRPTALFPHHLPTPRTLPLQ